MGQKIKLQPKLKCRRCDYEWRPRQEIVYVCPRCKSVYWDKPKVVTKKK